MNEVIEVKEDCFAYQIIKCSALKVMCCRDKKCPFYKTKEQIKQEEC